MTPLASLWFVQSEPRVMRSWMWNTVGAAALLGSALACGVVFGALDGTEGTARASGVVLAFAVVFLIGTVRVLVMGVVVTDDGLVVRELLFTKTLPWDQLENTDVVLSKGVQVRPFWPRVKVVHNPRIYYRVSAGQALKSVTVTSLGAYGRELAEERANRINDLIRQHRQAQAGPLPTPSRRPPDRSRRRRVRWRRS
jgi:hypothetical protein